MLDAILKQAGASEPGFTRKTVKWAITCTRDGRYTGVVPLGEDKGQTFDGCPQLSQPELVGGDGARAHFLVEGLPTIALFWKEGLDDKEQEKFRAKHAYFRGLLAQAAEVAPYLKAAAALLNDESAMNEVRADLSRQKAKPTESACFRIDGLNPLEQTDWHDWWRAFRGTLKTPKAKAAPKMRCLLTGEIVEPMSTHPKIKGLAGVGGLGTGDVLAGFDKQAFQSFGLEQAANAAMSEETATAYAETLNRLIAEKSIKLGNVLAVYWFDRNIPLDDDPLSWLKEPEAQTAAGAELKARKLLEAIRSGQRPDLSNNVYYALLLSGAAGRVMVREVMHGSFEALTANVENWFRDLAIVAHDGKMLAPTPKFLAVAGSLVRDLKDLPALMVQHLWRAAITGGDIPYAALAQATLRARIDVINDTPVSHARMGLIKAYHLRKGDSYMQAHVNPEHPSPAYHCGRLLAVLARLQRAALGDVGAGVVQRYYTAASQTPGLVIGRLAANAKNHLNKLEGGLAYWYENQIADVMAAMNDIPGILTLEQQSLFALGYYQQLAALNAGNKNKPAESENKAEPPADLFAAHA
ncbi:MULTISPECIES: type I-C CRISPR-associated protein Cas8c/Csd1 [Methylococcus]|uniref:Type I-C CRISPR-associated protein Cas8c/Csd1 n=1 Tax=Methylococcus capsulatus TaxID=414 RepID=A0ABZ2F8X3_METCP|nr:MULTISPECIES: type I-C CRISPR-associated protein Cas8c/Csd1 [Methylococcus]MDF9391328.1 type I-C CRISPR-associated protein Cas8c/Csd1 [Methylococcus capsulatus]